MTLMRCHYRSMISQTFKATAIVLGVAVGMISGSSMLLATAQEIQVNQNGSEDEGRTSTQLTADDTPNVDEEVVSGSGIAQDGTGEQNNTTNSEVENSQRGKSLSWPRSLADGRSVRPIALFSSQMDVLVSKDYLPVALEQFLEALASQQIDSNEETSAQISSSQYIVELVGRQLICRQGYIRLQPQVGFNETLSLGQQNVAVRTQDGRLGDVDSTSPNLYEFDSEGRAFVSLARTNGELTTLDYLWSSHGRLAGGAIEFELKLPRVEQNTLLIAIPENRRLTSSNSVVERMLDVDPTFAMATENERVRWYKVESGGVSEVRLKVVDDLATNSKSALLRRSVLQCNIKPSGVDWTSRMIFEQEQGSPTPRIAVVGSDVTSVKLDGKEVPFEKVVQEDGLSVLTLLVSESGEKSNFVSSGTLTVAGYEKGIEKQAWFHLPLVTLEGSLNASINEEVQLSFANPLRASDYEWPRFWDTSGEQVLDNGLITVRATGPLRTMDPFLRKVIPQESDNPTTIASSVRSGDLKRMRIMLSERPAEGASEISLQLLVGLSGVDAIARFNTEVDQERLGPLKLVVEDGWEIQSLRFSKTNREIPFSKNSFGKFIELWPDAAEVENGKLHLVVQGQRIFSTNTPHVNLPRSWFVRSEAKGRSKVLVAVTPTSDLAWGRNTSLIQSRLASAPETKGIVDLFPNVNARTLWFSPLDGCAPPLTFVRPSIDFSADTKLLLGYQDGQILEEVIVEVTSQSQMIEKLAVDFLGGTSGPSFQWWLQPNDGTDSFRLNHVIEENGSGKENYLLDLNNYSLDGCCIYARRVRPVVGEVALHLPVILGVLSQKAEVYLDPSFNVVERSDSTFVVPSIASSQFNEVLPNGVDLPNGYSNRWTRLKYDPSRQPRIVATVSAKSPEVNLVRREEIRYSGSVSGFDRVEVECQIYSMTDFFMKLPDGWTLISLERDNVAISVETQKDNEVRLGANFRDSVVNAVWQRRGQSRQFVRRVQIPTVDKGDAIVLSTHSEVLEGPESVFVRNLNGPFFVNKAYGNNSLSPGDAIWLFRREHLLAFSCLSCLAIFCLSFWLGKLSIFSVFGLLVLLITISLFQPAVSVGYWAWGILPVVGGGLLARALQIDRERSSQQKPVSAAFNNKVRNPDDDFSITNVTLRLLLVCGALFLEMDPAIGQNTEAIAGKLSSGSVDVLVPVDADGRFVGEMVYIPRNIFGELFTKDDDQQTRSSRFLSANYRMKIIQNDENADGGIRLESFDAQYSILQNEKVLSRAITLPILYDSVRRVELIDQSTRILPFERDGKFTRLGTLPLERLLKIRVTMTPKVLRDDSWERLECPIPMVANSKLMIESAVPLDTVRVGGASGWLVKEQKNLSRNWVADIGPVGLMQVEMRGGEDQVSSRQEALGRRYWVRSGRENAVIDCELDVPGKRATGENFQFVILDSKMPKLIGDSWKLIGAELYSPSRRLVTVQSLKDEPGSIRLVWTDVLDGELLDQDSIGKIVIPDVIASALGENADPWIAFQSETDLEIDTLEVAANEPLSVDQFLASWQGYRGAIERAFVPVGKIPELTVRMTPSGADSRTVDQKYHAHLSSDQLTIQYRLVVDSTVEGDDLVRVLASRELDITSVTINGKLVAVDPTRGDNEDIYLLSVGGENQSSVIEIIGSMPLELEKPFKFPMVNAVPHTSSTDIEYLVTRDYSIRLADEGFFEYKKASVDLKNSVFESWLPRSSRIVGVWNEENDLGTTATDLFQKSYAVERPIGAKACDQLVSITRIDRRWQMNAEFRFSEPTYETLYVELPEAWSDEIVIDGGAVIRKELSIEAGTTLLQINVNVPESGPHVLMLRSKASLAGLSMVNVPKVSLLECEVRNLFAAVPTEIDSQATNWRLISVERAELPEYFDGFENGGNYQVYRATNEMFSIELTPIANQESKAAIFCSDTHVFPKGSDLLVLQHWDLYPGSNSRVRIHVPDTVKVLGGWVNGQSQSVEVKGGQASRFIELPYVLDGCSQAVQLLTRSDVGRVSTGPVLPTLSDLEGGEKWISVYHEDDRERSKSPTRLAEMQSRRLFSLANSTIESISTTLKSGRVDEADLQPWLHKFLHRYEDIVLTAGLDPQLLANDVVKSAGDSTLEESDVVEQFVVVNGDRSTSEKWSELDARVQKELGFSNDSKIRFSDVGSKDSIFPLETFTGYRLDQVLNGTDREANTLLRKALERQTAVTLSPTPFLVLGIFGIILLWSQRNRQFMTPLLGNPSFWLLMLGVFCWVVLPVPIAATTAILAVLIPLLASSKYYRSIFRLLFN